MQLLANAPGNAMDAGQSALLGFLPLIQETQMEFQGLGFSLAQPKLLRLFGGVNLWNEDLSGPLPLTL